MRSTDIDASLKQMSEKRDRIGEGVMSTDIDTSSKLISEERQRRVEEKVGVEVNR